MNDLSRRIGFSVSSLSLGLSLLLLLISVPLFAASSEDMDAMTADGSPLPFHASNHSGDGRSCVTAALDADIYYPDQILKEGQHRGQCMDTTERRTEFGLGPVHRHYWADLLRHFGFEVGDEQPMIANFMHLDGGKPRWYIAALPSPAYVDQLIFQRAWLFPSPFGPHVALTVTFRGDETVYLIPQGLHSSASAYEPSEIVQLRGADRAISIQTNAATALGDTFSIAGAFWGPNYSVVHRVMSFAANVKEMRRDYTTISQDRLDIAQAGWKEQIYRTALSIGQNRMDEPFQLTRYNCGTGLFNLIDTALYADEDASMNLGIDPALAKRFAPGQPADYLVDTDKAFGSLQARRLLSNNRGSYLLPNLK